MTQFLSDKILSIERITLVENNKIINNANIKNTFFSNIAINLNVPECHKYEGISSIISDPILKAIGKYRNYPSKKAIKRVSNSNDLFFFYIVDSEKILKEISGLGHTKTFQELDTTTKIFKEKGCKFFQKFFISRLMVQSRNKTFHQFSNWLMLP